MHPFLSMADNRAVDEYAIQTCGIPGQALMGSAGQAVVHQLIQKNLLSDNPRVLILTGKGNNGGDGYVIAGELLERGHEVNVLSVIPNDDVAGDAKIHLDRLLQRDPDLWIWQGSAKQKQLFQEADLIIDALLGTGIKGDLRKPYPELIQLANLSGAMRIAIDVPSGVIGDLGDVLSTCIQADLTVSMGYGKQTCLFEPARSHSGEIISVDIGFPKDSLDHIQGDILYRLTPIDVDPQKFTRPADVHKYQSGKVFILAGSRGFSGAAILAAHAAVRSGAGLVKLGVPESIGEIAETSLLEAVVGYLPETDTHGVSQSGFDTILSDSDWSDVTALGPGLGRHPETVDLVLSLTSQIQRPLVLDADALYAISTRPSVLKDRSAPTLLTPHVGEFKRLTGMKPSSAPNWMDAQRFAMEYQTYVLLKGAPSILSTPEGIVFVNATGNPGMATGGSGDVLTGVISALWSQWSEIPDVLNLGMYIHGLSADRIVRDKGVLGLIAGDIVAGLPTVLREYGDLPD